MASCFLSQCIFLIFSVSIHLMMVWTYEPFVKYYLGIILKAYNEFENWVEHLKNRSLSKPERIKVVIDRKVGKITKKEIMELCPATAYVRL